MKYYVVAEVREDYESFLIDGPVYNDYVSRKSMLDLVCTLNELGYNCAFLGGNRELYALYRSVSTEDLKDIVFINYNYGYPARFKRGQAPILLEMMYANYSGSDPLTSLLVNDKELTKKIARQIGVSAPKSILITQMKDHFQQRLKDTISLPAVVKPNAEGSSLGIHDDSFCITYAAAAQKAQSLIEEFHEVIIEEYVAGYECTVWIIGNTGDFRLVAPLIVSLDGAYYFEQKIFTLEDKASHRRAYARPESVLPQKTVGELCETAKNLFQELGLRDYGRLDFRVHEGQPIFIEANALPIFSRSSEIGQLEAFYGFTYEQICGEFVATIQNRLSGID